MIDFEPATNGRELHDSVHGQHHGTGWGPQAQAYASPQRAPSGYVTSSYSSPSPAYQIPQYGQTAQHNTWAGRYGAQADTQTAQGRNSLDMTRDANNRQPVTQHGSYGRTQSQWSDWRWDQGRQKYYRCRYDSQGQSTPQLLKHARASTNSIPQATQSIFGKLEWLCATETATIVCLRTGYDQDEY